MKTIKKVFLSIVLGTLIFALTSCFVGSDSDKFEITNYPKATYVKGENFDWSTLKINVNGTIYSYEEAKELKGIEFPEIVLFNSETGYQREEGTYAATIKYNALTATFQYTVLDSYFANGNGTKENPYQISTQYQLKEALVDHNAVKYYVLINDIILDSSFVTANKVKNLHLNGQGYKISNLTTGFINHVDGKVTVENISFDVNSNKDDYYGVVSSLQGYNEKSEVTFKNINTYGRISNWTNLESIFGYVWNSKTVLENCNNYMYIDAHKARYCGLFTSTIAYSSQLFVLNCKNYGTIFAESVGLFYGAGIDYTENAMLIIDSQTKNYGEVISTIHNSNLFMANYDDKRNWFIEGQNVIHELAKVYKYNDHKGLKAELYNASDEFVLKTNDNKVSDDYKNLGVDALSVDSSYASFIKEGTGYSFSFTNPEDILKVSKFEIKLMGAYTFANAAGIVGSTDKSGVQSKGGANHIFYLSSVESDSTQSAYAKFVELLKTINNYKIRNNDSYNGNFDDPYKLEEGFKPTNQTLVDAEGRQLKVYERTTDNGGERVFVYDVLEHEGLNENYYEYAGASYYITINLFDVENNVIGSCTIKIENK